ncbi:MAG TPA: S-layer homology domain-containing protein [Candidatus Limnocylindrales bacterium]
MPSKRRSALVVVLVAWLVALASPAAVAAGSGRFVDDNSSKYENAIEAMVKAGVMSPCDKRHDRFCPNRSVSRGEMAGFLVKAFNLSATSGVHFKDVTKHTPHATAIDRVVTAGIASGCSPKKFCPNSHVSRGRMAAYLAKALHLTATSTKRYKDVPKSNPFATAISRLSKAGIAIGCGNGKFCPGRDITRAETAGFLERALTITRVSAQQPTPGNPTGGAAIPPGAGEADASVPDHVVGSGTPASCTSKAVVAAVAKGGVITFDCGPSPVTIYMSATAKVFNNKPDVVIDGGGLVTLNGMGDRRILYMNTCDPDLVWTTSHCQNQAHPTLTVQNIAFTRGRSSGHETEDGGGAIFVRGGRFRVVNAGFYGNRCASTGPDIGGASLQVFSQHDGLPVYVVNSTFGGSGSRRNECSNAGGISSIGVSWTILNSVFTHNRAIGSGANPPKAGKPGGGNGGAIYNDGNEMTLRVEGTRIEGNWSNHEGGSGIFFVSNNRTGFVVIKDSILRNNDGDGFQTHPGIFFLGDEITFTNSIVE